MLFGIAVSISCQLSQVETTISKPSRLYCDIIKGSIIEYEKSN